MVGRYLSRGRAGRIGRLARQRRGSSCRGAHVHRVRAHRHSPWRRFLLHRWLPRREAAVRHHQFAPSGSYRRNQCCRYVCDGGMWLYLEVALRRTARKSPAHAVFRAHLGLHIDHRRCLISGELFHGLDAIWNNCRINFRPGNSAGGRQLAAHRLGRHAVRALAILSYLWS